MMECECARCPVAIKTAKDRDIYKAALLEIDNDGRNCSKINMIDFTLNLRRCFEANPDHRDFWCSACIAHVALKEAK